MRVFSGLILVLIEKIVPLALAVFAIIKVAKAQSISKKSKIILSIIILFVLFIIRIWHFQSDFENALMLGVFLQLLIYIGQVVLVIVVIRWIIKTTSISKTFKIILLVIISVCVCIMLINYRSETMDEKYIKINEIVNNKSLIGLSKEEVVELLGEPSRDSGDIRPNLGSIYEYSAGTIFEEWFWGKCYQTKYYRLNIWFDKNGIVKMVSIEDITDL